MASVSVVSSADFRANLSQPQQNASESEDPFSLLLNSVAEVKAGAKRPEAPEVPDRRKDAPARQPKPEADPDRQARRQAKDTAKPDAKRLPEPAAPPKAASPEKETEESGEEENVSVQALLIVALDDSAPQEIATPQVEAAAAEEAIIQDAAVAPAAAGVEAVPAIGTAPASALAAAADAATVAPEPAQAANPVQKPAKVSIQLEVTSPGNGKVHNLALPEAAAETVLSQARPQQAAARFMAEVQSQVQPGPVNLSAASPLQGPAHLEMLNAAISKHVQLALGFEARDAAPDAQKHLISSNAVAPNFAMTAQANAPLQVQAQQAAEASRAVPLDNLAVEIATRASRGERRFEIRLDPPELGRIDVRLEIDSKGNTTTRLTVERAETLDMLQRDARGLEKALQNAGLKTDPGSLQFSLQQDPQAHGRQGHGPEIHGRHDPVQTEGEAMAEVSINNASLAAQLRGGVDIRI